MISPIYFMKHKSAIEILNDAGFYTCNECGGLFQKQFLQIVNESEFLSDIKYYCKNHRKPYDKSCFGFSHGKGMYLKYIKEIEVDEQGKPIKK